MLTHCHQPEIISAWEAASRSNSSSPQLRLKSQAILLMKQSTKAPNRIRAFNLTIYLLIDSQTHSNPIRILSQLAKSSSQASLFFFLGLSPLFLLSHILLQKATAGSGVRFLGRAAWSPDRFLFGWSEPWKRRQLQVMSRRLSKCNQTTNQRPLKVIRRAEGVSCDSYQPATQTQTNPGPRPLASSSFLQGEGLPVTWAKI